MMAKGKSMLWVMRLVITASSLILICMVTGCNSYDSIDSSSLTDVLLKSDMVRIYDKEMDEVLHETLDEDEIEWLGLHFIADRNSPIATLYGWYPDRYYILFYNDSELIAEIVILEDLKFNWNDTDWPNFRLTADSYRFILPWLCRQTGKSLSDFFPGHERGWEGEKVEATIRGSK